MSDPGATNARLPLRGFLPYAGAYGVARVVAAASAALLSALAFVVAGAAAVGLYAAIVTTTLVAGSAAGGWVGQALLRYGTDGRTGWWRFMSIGRGAASLAVGSGASAVIALAVAVIAARGRPAEVAVVAALAGLATVAFALLTIEILRRQAQLQPWRAGYLEIVRAVAITLPPAIAAPAASGLGATALATAVCIGLVLASLGAVAISDSVAGRPTADAGDIGLVRLFWGYGWPLALWILFSGFYQFSDRVMLTWLDSATAAGEYSLIYDIFNRGLVFPLVAIATATNPLVYERYERGSPVEARRLNRLGIIAQVAATAVVAFPAAAAAALAVNRIAWVAWPEAASALLVYLAGALWAIASSVQRRQMGEAVTQPLLWRLITFAVMNTLLNAILIPPIGILGAAIATVLGAVGYLISVSRLVYRLEIAK